MKQPNNRELLLTLDLKEPILVSSRQDLDRLRFKVKREYFFVSAESLQTLEKDTELVLKLPPQVDSSDTLQAFKDAAEHLKKASTFAVVVICFIINLMLSTTLQLGLDDDKHAQIVVHIPLVNIVFPSNALIISSFFFQLAHLRRLSARQTKLSAIQL